LLPVVALAEARLGKIDRAIAMLDQDIARARAEDAPLVIRVRLHSARARVAIVAGDTAGFEQHAEHAAELCRSVNNSVLMLQHVALLDEAARHGMAPRAAREADGVSSVPTVQHTRLTTAGVTDDVATDAGQSSDVTI
jgi:hypothetical protein